MPRPGKPIDDKLLLVAAGMRKQRHTWEQISWDISAMNGARDARGKARHDLMVSDRQIRRALDAAAERLCGKTLDDLQGPTRGESPAQLEARSSESQVAASEGA